jgi:hypothetical protein
MGVVLLLYWLLLLLPLPVLSCSIEPLRVRLKTLAGEPDLVGETGGLGW